MLDVCILKGGVIKYLVQLININKLWRIMNNQYQYE